MSEDDKKLALIKPQGGVNEIKSDLTAISKLMKNAMVKDHDYGTIPGTKNNTLYDAGAEKLAKFFGLVPNYELSNKVENFETGLFFYQYKCSLTHFNTGKFAGAAERSCSSFEKKYLMKYSRRQTPEELVESINTVQAMAQKRAFVEAVKTATMASSIFTSDGMDEEEAPNRPSTKLEDPERITIMGHLFGVAADRGFSGDSVKRSCYTKFKVESMDNVSNKQLSSLTEYLITAFEVVGKGNKPKKFGENVTSPEAPELKDTPKEPVVSPTTEESKIEEAEVVETSPELSWEEEARLKREKGEKTEEEDTSVASRKCYNCGEDITADKGWYCDDKCKDEYWEKTHPKSKTTNEKKEKFDNFIKNKGKKTL